MKTNLIVDIDGTVAKVGDRLKHIQQERPDWDSFYKGCGEDEPHTDILLMAVTLSMKLNLRLVFCTGRREFHRAETEEWLMNHAVLGRGEYSLLMRPTGDKRHDTQVKPELLKNAGFDTDNVWMILEDRNSMVAKWRELGFRCLQVAEGDF
jgi:hypothetical protein